MIVAAIVCAATMSHAAAANWKAGATEIHDGTGSASALYTGTAYIFDASVMSQSALYALIAGGTEIGSSTAGYMQTASVSGGVFNNVTFANGEQGSADKIPYYFVIVDNDKAYFSNQLEVKPNGNNTAKNIAFGIQYDEEDPTALPNSVSLPSDTYAAAGGWVKTSSGVPEPTSGLLVLLGVAGLALRRRA